MAEQKKSSKCVCPYCGYTRPKLDGILCSNKKCPKCGHTLEERSA